MARWWWVGLGLVWMASCYEPELASCTIACGPNNSCPDDMTCNEGLCRRGDESCEPGPTNRRFASITAGGEHACAIDVEGQLYCWGNDDFSQTTGAGTPLSLPRPAAVLVTVTDVSRWLAVDAGGAHTCAIGEAPGGPALYCWGNNEQGQCGVTPNRQVAPTAIELPNSDAPVEIAAGEDHTCVRSSTGRVYCSGSNENGQLGDTSNTPRGSFDDVAGAPTDWTAITAGRAFTCGVRGTTEPQCWGVNESSQLGNGSIGGNSSLPNRTAGAFTAVTSLSAGLDASCLIDLGAMQCWGDNNAGEVGVPVSTSDAVIPTLVGGDASTRTWTSVRAGDAFACGLTDGGEVYCWGELDERLGDGSLQPRIDAGPQLGREVGDAMGVGAFAFDVGRAFGCGLFGTVADGGLVRCWGSNSHGQLGNGELTLVPKATTIADPGPWSTVRLGRASGCAIKQPGGTVWCWGDNEFSQVRSGGARFEPVPVQNTFAGNNVRDLALGTTHACALVATSGTMAVRCWGENGRNELGVSEVALREATPILPVDTTWRSLEAAGDATCAIGTLDTVVCWGSSDWLFAAQPTLPTDVTTDVGDPTALRLGQDSGCVLSGGGADVFCFGSDDEGERGDGQGNDPEMLPPTSVVPSLLATGISRTYGRHRCAFDPVATFCWGENSSHQGGPDTAGTSFNPLRLPELVTKAPGPGEDTLVAGGEFTCALATTQEIHCWGDNTRQQCTNSVSNQGVPMPIVVEGPAPRFRTLAAGETTACAVTEEGALYCWGLCNHGQCAGGQLDRNELVPLTLAP